MNINKYLICKSTFFCKSSLSQITLLLLVFALVVYKFILFPHENMITWDNFGYYLYLPKFFIYNDPHMVNLEGWLYPVIERYGNTPHVYQLNPVGDHHIIRYPIGQSLFYAPFFFIAHIIAGFTSHPADGFSFIYQVVLRWGCFLYVVAGLILLRRALAEIFSESITSVCLVVLVFGTNLHIYAGSLSPHETLFFLYALMLYITVKRSNYFSLRFWFIAGAVAGLACITRPTDVIMGIIPLLWGCGKIGNGFFNLLHAFVKRSYVFLLAFIPFAAFLLIQMLYWRVFAGQWVYYTYETTEETLHLTAPYTLEFFFSFRKGWFIYTPLMFVALLGFVEMFRQRKDIFWAVLPFYLLNIYLVSSWTSWWYADSFSSRAMVQTLGISIIPMGFLCVFVWRKGYLFKTLFIAIAILLLSLNLFQTWQFHKSIFPLDRLTKEAYAYIFLKRKIDVDKRESLMLVNRALDETYIPHIERYKRRSIAFFDYQDAASNMPDIAHQLCDTLFYSGGYSLKLDSDNAFSNVVKYKYSDISAQPHIWIKSSAYVYTKKEYEDNLFSLVTHFTHRGENYKYRTGPLNGHAIKPYEWNYIEFLYLSPELRSKNDKLMVYFWLRGESSVWIDNFSVEIYERK